MTVFRTLSRVKAHKMRTRLKSPSRNPSGRVPWPWRNALDTHLERGPELVRHEIVEDRVDGGRQVVQDARHVVQHLVNVDD